MRNKELEGKLRRAYSHAAPVFSILSSRPVRIRKIR